RQGLEGPGQAAEVARVGGHVVPAAAPRSARLSEAAFAWGLVLPAVAAVVVVVFLPLLYSFWMSLADVNLLRTSGPALELFGVRLPLFRFVCVQNYIRVLPHRLYWISLRRTAYFVAAFVVQT